MLSTAKDILEIIYYIAFTIFTYKLVEFAGKTYTFDTDKSYKLFCKIYVDESSKHKHGFRFGVEIFNNGNGIAEEVELKLDDKLITTIDFIKPKESFFFPLGTVGQMLGGNYVWLDTEDGQKRPDSYKISLIVNNQETVYRVSTGLLYAYRSEVDSDLKDVATQIKDFNKNTQSNLSQISKKMDDVARKLR